MKTDCRQLDAFLDGELADAEESDFQVHLETCAECRDACRIDNDLDRLIMNAWESVEIPKSINDRRVEKRTARLPLLRRWRLAEINAAIAVLAIALLAIVIVSDSVILRPFVANENTDKEGLIFFDDEANTTQKIHDAEIGDRQQVQFFASETSPSFVRTREQNDKFTIMETHLIVQPTETPNSN